LLGTVPPLNRSKCLAINEYNIIFGIVPNGVNILLVRFIKRLPDIRKTLNVKRENLKYSNNQALQYICCCGALNS